MFVKEAYQEALAAFYHALQLRPALPAIALNMLQTLLVEQQSSYRSVLLNDLVRQIDHCELSEANQQRFVRLQKKYPQINEVLKAATTPDAANPVTPS